VQTNVPVCGDSGVEMMGSVKSVRDVGAEEDIVAVRGSIVSSSGRSSRRTVQRTRYFNRAYDSKKK